MPLHGDVAVIELVDSDVCIWLLARPLLRLLRQTYPYLDTVYTDMGLA